MKPYTILSLWQNFNASNMILQTLSNIWIRKHIFYSFIKNVSRCYRQVKPRNYFAHHNVTSSARVIYLCCSTSVDDFATNKVIYMFDFLVFNNCWCVFDSLCLWVIFCQRIYMKSRFCIRSGEPCILLFEMNEDIATGCDTNPCISIVIFFSFSGEWGGHCPHHQLNRYMLWTPRLTIFDVLKHTLFVRNGYKLEVFWNHNIS
jgi:hypothetical protein